MLLPDENREVLQILLYFLSDVTAAVKENQMTPTNLAVCLAPSLFHLNTLKRENSSPRYAYRNIEECSFELLFLCYCFWYMVGTGILLLADDKECREGIYFRCLRKLRSIRLKINIVSPVFVLCYRVVTNTDNSAKRYMV